MTVSRVVTQGCSTSLVEGLARQLIEEVRCMHPRLFRSIAQIPHVTRSSEVWPWVQTPVAEALVRVAQSASSRRTLHINSALRTLPQQYLLYRWYRAHRCGVVLARPPGVSSHEEGRALDLAQAARWRRSMESAGFRWWGADDPMHFDLESTHTEVRGAGVRAFQRLWNRHHPTDRLREDGVYDPTTEARLERAPPGGFPRNHPCGR